MCETSFVVLIILLGRLLADLVDNGEDGILRGDRKKTLVVDISPKPFLFFQHWMLIIIVLAVPLQLTPRFKSFLNSKHNVVLYR